MLLGEVSASTMSRGVVESWVLNAIITEYRKRNRPISLKELLVALREKELSDFAIREAIWLLMDRGLVDLTVDRMIKPTPKAVEQP